MSSPNSSAQTGGARKAADGQDVRHLSLEDIIGVLAAGCDGAKKRDGSGFSKSDAQDGKRLAAMASRKVPWSKSDFERAISLASRYGQQAVKGLGLSELDSRRVLQQLRSGRMPTARPTVEKPAEYRYLALSPAGKSVFFYFLPWKKEYEAILPEIRALARLSHGHRRVRVSYNNKAVVSWNGKRLKSPRWEVDLNGTTQGHLLMLARKFDFAVDPAVSANMDEYVDELRKYPRALYLDIDYDERGRERQVAVFDLDKRDDRFGQAMKSLLPGQFTCDPKDDWNWVTDVTPATLPRIQRIAQEFQFAVDEDLVDLFRA